MALEEIINVVYKIYVWEIKQHIYIYIYIYIYIGEFSVREE